MTELATTTVWRAFDDLSARDVHDALALRAAVFVVEQRCLYLDVDGLDPLARHLLVREGDRSLVAYARVLPPGSRFELTSIGRVVVRGDRRGRGLGAAVVREALAHIEAADGPVAVKLSAQAHLRGMYEGLGFVVCSEPYDEDGIPHLAMVRGGAS